jgi:proteasome assembly chaperone (PAC2) family protein
VKTLSRYSRLETSQDWSDKYPEPMASKALLTPRQGPVLLMAFSGWNDACDAASDVVNHIDDVYGSEPVAEIAAGPYYDLQTHRPLVSVDADGHRVVSWPSTEILLARHPQADLILVRGPEPTFRWQEFCDEILAVVQGLDPVLAVSLGCVSADVAHTQDLPVRAFTQNAELAATLGASGTAHEGFTGITGVMADACDAAGIPALRMWGSVPSYVSAPPSPKATLAITQELDRLLGLTLDVDDLPQRAALWSRNLDELATEQGLDAHVASIKQQSNDGEQRVGDRLADEILGFLRRRTT